MYVKTRTMCLQSDYLMIIFNLFFVHRVCATLDALKTLGYDWKHVLESFSLTLIRRKIWYVRITKITEWVNQLDNGRQINLLCLRRFPHERLDAFYPLLIHVLTLYSYDQTPKLAMLQQIQLGAMPHQIWQCLWTNQGCLWVIKSNLKGVEDSRHKFVVKLRLHTAISSKFKR